MRSEINIHKVPLKIPLEFPPFSPPNEVDNYLPIFLDSRQIFEKQDEVF